MRNVRRITLLLSFALGLVTARASAQNNVTAQGTFAASAGVTDNVLQVPEPGPNTPADLPAPEWDALFVIAPGVSLQLERPLSTHTLNYVFGLTLYAVHDEANSFTHSLAYGNQFPLSQTLTLNTGAGVTLGQLSNFNRTNQAQNAVVAPQNEPGDDLFITANVNEGLGKEFSPDWVGSQNAGLTHYRPFDNLQGNSWIANLGFGLQRLFENDIVGPQIGFAYTRFSEIEDDAGNETQPAQHELTSTLAVSWAHQFGLTTASNLQLGIVHSMDVEAAAGLSDDPDASARHIVQPFGVASIGYAVDAYQATLTYQHTVGPNVFLNTLTLSDSLSAAVNVPLGRLPLDYSLGGGISAIQQIDQDGNFGAVQPIVVADTALTYTPPSFPVLSVSARYQFIKQFEVETEDQFQEILAFTQNTWLLTVGLTFPDAVDAGPGALLAQPFQPVPSQSRDILRPPPEQNAQTDDERSGGNNDGSGDDEE